MFYKFSNTDIRHDAPNHELACKDTSFRKPTVIDELINTTMTVYDEDKKAAKLHVIHRDVQLLFNQQRLSNLSPTAIDELFRVSNHEDAFAGLDDNAKISFLKSRYAQRLSELHEWDNYLSTHIDKVKEEVKRHASEALTSSNKDKDNKPSD